MPNNGLATSAHSGANAWGGDLDGNQDFYAASSYLYAPVIDLSGLTSATLTFWTTFDFSRFETFTIGNTDYTIWEEDGGVLISTNASVPPSLNLPLAVEYTNQIADTWRQETVDLTKWVGQTIQVVFYYQAIPLGDTIYGWTIDDIRITGVVAGGNVSITKNLGQGTWSLSSLSSIGLVPVQSGVAPSITFSNLAAGNYVAQFGDVPFYQTPDEQTNTLTVGGTVQFHRHLFLPRRESQRHFRRLGKWTTSAPSPPTGRSSPTRMVTGCRTTPSSSPEPIQRTRHRGFISRK